MEINDVVFVRKVGGHESDNPGTVIDFSGRMVLVHFDRTGLIGRFLEAELVVADGSIIREEQSVEGRGSM